MCSPVPCDHCGKTTWAGCGMHVAEVLARIPKEDRCVCAHVPLRPAAWYPRTSYGARR